MVPSLHVYNSLVVNIVLLFYDDFRKRKIIVWISTLWTLAIVSSTVFIKQHSILYGMWGAALAVTMTAMVYGLPNLADIRKTYIRKEDSKSSAVVE